MEAAAAQATPEEFEYPYQPRLQQPAQEETDLDERIRGFGAGGETSRCVNPRNNGILMRRRGNSFPLCIALTNLTSGQISLFWGGNPAFIRDDEIKSSNICILWMRTLAWC